MIDVLVDVQYGDCGKGRSSKYLNERMHYSTIAKYNGGGNAGHSVFVGDTEYVAHYLTSGLYSKNTRILIGPGCVLNVAEFLKEIEQFESFKVKDRVFVHPYCHIITDEHIAQDDKDNKIGSTKKGIGPAYSGKYARTNKRALDIDELKPYLMDTPLKMKNVDSSQYWWNECRVDFFNDVLMEGSQGWGLDIDWGNYPYVTSSHIHPAFAFATFGIPLSELGAIYGVCKPYLTYVGSNESIVYADEKDIEAIRKAGNEYGRTTGRPRKIGYLDLRQLVGAVNQTGVTKLFINKCDVLEATNIYKFFDLDGTLCTVGNMQDMKMFIENKLFKMTKVDTIFYGHSADSNRPYKIVSK